MSSPITGHPKYIPVNILISSSRSTKVTYVWGRRTLVWLKITLFSNCKFQLMSNCVTFVRGVTVGVLWFYIFTKCTFYSGIFLAPFCQICQHDLWCLVMDGILATV
jgi:hypothetical protein